MIEQAHTEFHSEGLHPEHPGVSESTEERGLPSVREIRGLSQMVLEHLPLPVIAVDGGGRVTLANRRARTLTRGIADGRMLFEFFPDAVTGRANVAIATQTPRTIRDCTIGATRFEVDCVPLPPGGDGAAGLLVLRPA
jgi:transcriptional regulator of aromatic amino acid metabolism